MIELNKSEYDILKNLFPDDHVYVEVPMIVNQRRGRAWVDDKTKPSLGLITMGDMAFVEGDGDIEQLRIPLKICESIIWEVSCDDRFGELIRDAFKDTKKTLNIFFKHDRKQHHHGLPDGFELRKINAELFERVNETGEDWLFAMFYDAHDFFANCGYGYAVMHENKLVSAASGSAFDGSRVDIGIGTNPEFRNLGLSKAATSAIIKELLSDNVEPVWITGPENHASRAVAERNGFRETESYTTFWTKTEAA